MEGGTSAQSQARFSVLIPSRALSSGSFQVARQSTTPGEHSCLRTPSEESLVKGVRWFSAHPAVCRGLRAVSYCSRILCMPRGNPSPKLAITVNPDIHENILAAAAREGVSVSAWMTAAAREALRRRAGLAAVAVWEEHHGRFTAEEMNEAHRSVRAQLRTPRKVQRPA